MPFAVVATSSNAFQFLEFRRLVDEFLQRVGGLLLGAIGGGHGRSSRGEGLKEGPGRVAPRTTERFQIGILNSYVTSSTETSRQIWARRFTKEEAANKYATTWSTVCGPTTARDDDDNDNDDVMRPPPASQSR